ncbi:MAG: hypothetical protein HLUCCA11_03955 [Phormidesmis priestleyi Ana]|uniref:Uncharacterized protein n=1 Tax=Phormidesmis priestleyi Ana TaxID=1666911 RepID=A0A0P8C5S7_9CYAN|nr:MAG: hypothetical protein HLUCCA11_03955 [Phormidesmis priestleyi Ana]
MFHRFITDWPPLYGGVQMHLSLNRFNRLLPHPSQFSLLLPSE